MGKITTFDDWTDYFRQWQKDIGLDTAKFDACFANSATSAAVQKDIDEGKALGITGTPAFFINGRALTGAQPIEAFSRVIDDELTRTTTAAAKTQ